MAYTSKCEMTIYLKFRLRIYRKIPRISRGAYIFQRPFMRGLFLEGLIYGGKFAFQNRSGQPYSIFGEAYTWRGLFSEFYGMYPNPSPHPRLKGPQVRCIYISPSCLGWSCFKLTAALMTPAFALNPSFVTT